MSTTAANIISELDLNSSFSELTEAQKLAALNSALQALSELYNDAGKDAFVQNTLEGASVPVAEVRVPNRTLFLDENFSSLGAPYYSTVAAVLSAAQALTPAPSTAKPVLIKSFAKNNGDAYDWSGQDLDTLAASGIFVQQINDSLTNKETKQYGVDSGTGNAKSITNASIGSLSAGLKLRFKNAHGNTGAVTVSLNGGTAKSIKKNVTDSLISGDLIQNKEYEIIYDGTNWQIDIKDTIFRTAKTSMVGGPSAYTSLASFSLLQGMVVLAIYVENDGGDGVFPVTESLPYTIPTTGLYNLTYNSLTGILALECGAVVYQLSQSYVTVPDWEFCLVVKDINY